MSGFHTKTFIKHDDYMTPKYAWDNIKQFIPKDKVIWEAFYGNGKSGSHLQELGFNVIHEPVDFFENDLGEMIVSNPPFSKAKAIMERMLILDKPFILIFPSSKIDTSYMRKWKDKNLQIIIPRKRIHFEKHIDGTAVENYKSSCNFDCFYYCYKMGLEKDITWLDDDESVECMRCKNYMIKKEQNEDGVAYTCDKCLKQEEECYAKN